MYIIHKQEHALRSYIVETEVRLKAERDYTWYDYKDNAQPFFKKSKRKKILSSD